MLIVLIILTIVIFLLSKEYFPPDSVVLLSIVSLVSLKILTPQEAFSGFGTSLVVTLVCIFILGGILKKNGVVEYLANKLTALNTSSYPRILSVVVFPVGLLSAFMSNTSVVALTFMPFNKMADKIKISNKKILMPLAFASLLGGTSTLIGTSTNIVGNNFLLKNGLQEIGMFEFLPIGLTLVLVSYLFFVFFGEKLFSNTGEKEENIDNTNIYYNYENNNYHADFVVGTDSRLLGKSVKYLEENNLSLLKIERNGAEVSKDYSFQAGDYLQILGEKEVIKKFYVNNSANSLHLQNLYSKKELIELLILPTSRYVGQSINEEEFLKENNFKVIAVSRKNHKFDDSIHKINLHVGDIIICEVDSDSLEFLINENEFVVLNKKSIHDFSNINKGFITLFIFLSAVLLAAFNILPISISLMLAVMSVVVLNIIPTNEIFKDVDWRLIILIAGMSAFSVAFTKTGLDTFIADSVTHNLSFLPTLALLFLFMVLTVLLTQPMSNSAAVLVMLPIALKVAENISTNAKGFLVAVILSASISMITPFEPASLLVMKSGDYKIIDFIKIGGPLTLISLIIILLFVEVVYF